MPVDHDSIQRSSPSPTQSQSPAAEDRISAATLLSTRQVRIVLIISRYVFASFVGGLPILLYSRSTV
ncbi:hypothetical protein BDW75DRAFT_199095 [Aspergillus navahoensis]